MRSAGRRRCWRRRGYEAVTATELVVADIGGTHARFAIAQVGGGRVLALDGVETLRTAEHGSLQLAWEAYAAMAGRPLPRAAALSVAGPVDGAAVQLTNNPWVLRPALIPERLGADVYTLVNDFAAVAHAVGALGAEQFRHLCGPDVALPALGAVTVLGPGTGLGVALLHRDAGGARVIATEGGHGDFAPLDALEDQILVQLRRRHRRVSVERIVSGPGLANLHEALAAIEGRAVAPRDERALWAAALAGGDALASAALDRFCLSLGSVAGDLALAQGSVAVVLAGGVGARVAGHLPRSGFAARFVAKGRFETRMAGLPVYLLTHPEPGLYGAAAAFAGEHA